MKEYLGPLESIPRDVDILKTRRMPNIISMKVLFLRKQEDRNIHVMLVIVFVGDYQKTLRMERLLHAREVFCFSNKPGLKGKGSW